MPCCCLLLSNSLWPATTPQEITLSLDMHFFLLQKSKIIAHIKMWTSLWDRLNWGGNEILTGDISDFSKCGVIACFPTPSQQGTAMLPEKSLLQPEGSAICPLPLYFGVFSWLSTKVTNPANSFIVLATTVYTPELSSYVHTFLNTEYIAKHMLYMWYFLKVFTKALFVEKLTGLAIQVKSLWFSCFYRYSLLFSVAGV